MVIVISSIVNFAVVLFILWYFGRKPIAEFFQQRRHTIQVAISEAEAQYLEAEKSLSTWQTRMKESEAEARTMFDDAKASMKKFSERTVASAQNETQRIKQESQLLGKGEILRAKQGLQTEMAEKSIALAERYLSKQLDERDKHQLVSEYVEIVGNGKA